ncbi:MAG: AbrB/MazE/SpoVT family DNA-binding domain-containing protein [Thermodesulfobacteriota bacterium]
MRDTLTVNITQRGVLTLPKSIRKRYKLKPGDSLTLLDVDGVLILSPLRSEIDLLADRISKALIDKGETLDSVLRTLREERKESAKKD